VLPAVVFVGWLFPALVCTFLAGCRSLLLRFVRCVVTYVALRTVDLLFRLSLLVTVVPAVVAVVGVVTAFTVVLLLRCCSVAFVGFTPLRWWFVGYLPLLFRCSLCALRYRLPGCLLVTRLLICVVVTRLLRCYVVVVYVCW